MSSHAHENIAGRCVFLYARLLTIWLHLRTPVLHLRAFTDLYGWQDKQDKQTTNQRISALHTMRNVCVTFFTYQHTLTPR